MSTRFLPRTHLGATLAILVSVAVFGSLVTAARAQDGDKPQQTEPVDIRDGAAVDATLADVGMDAAWRAATGLHDIVRTMTVSYPDESGEPVQQLVTVADLLRSTTEQHDRVAKRLRELAVDLTQARQVERLRSIDRNRADAHLRGVVALVRSVAIDLFAGTGEADEALLGADGQALVQAQRTLEIQGHTLDELMTRRDQAIEDLDDAERALTAARDRLADLTAAHGEVRDEATELARTRAGLEGAARSLLPIAAEAFALADVPRAASLTPRATDAYVRAELTTTELSPRCRISWRTIAAVAKVEGAHGTHGGRSLLLSGRPDSDIIGIALNGSNVDNFGDVVASIPDTDDGRYDADTRYDRAVGPLQFIPQTWARWEADGDGDGEYDPQDLDDAALATAGLLCSYGSQQGWEVWKRAVFAYNHSPAYVASVKSALDGLQRVRLGEVEGVELRPKRPYGVYEPMPIPEPDSETNAEESAN